MYFNNSTTWGRLYKQLKILDHPIYTQLDSITVIYVKIVKQHKKDRETKAEIWEVCHTWDHLMLPQHQKHSFL